MQCSTVIEFGPRPWVMEDLPGNRWGGKRPTFFGVEHQKRLLATSNKCMASSNKKLLGAAGIATRSKDATRGSWPYY